MRRISIARHNYLPQRITAKGPSQWPGKPSLIFLAGILSESIFDSDWSPIRFRNIKILSLKERNRFGILVGSTKIMFNELFPSFLCQIERILCAFNLFVRLT